MIDERPKEPGLITPCVIARELGEPINDVQQVLVTRSHISPLARAGNGRDAGEAGRGLPVAERVPTVELLLTYRAAGRVLGVTERTIWTYVQRGELPAVRFGGSVRIDPADLRVFIDNAKRIEESDSASSNNADAGGGQ